MNCAIPIRTGVLVGSLAWNKEWPSLSARQRISSKLRFVWTWSQIWVPLWQRRCEFLFFLECVWSTVEFWLHSLLFYWSHVAFFTAKHFSALRLPLSFFVYADNALDRLASALISFWASFLWGWQLWYISDPRTRFASSAAFSLCILWKLSGFWPHAKSIWDLTLFSYAPAIIGLSRRRRLFGSDIEF